MDRRAWQAAVHGVAASDKTETTQHARTWESCIPFFHISMTFPIKAHLNSDYISALWIVGTRLEGQIFVIRHSSNHFSKNPPNAVLLTPTVFTRIIYNLTIIW